jgi:hypothetical protein
VSPAPVESFESRNVGAGTNCATGGEGELIGQDGYFHLGAVQAFVKLFIRQAVASQPNKAVLAEQSGNVIVCPYRKDPSTVIDFI